ncbi:MAG: AbgT family transporter [Ketobacteraceae bacterium]|nr:AbgT family transporter [Ketobacteraceae bacterium]
MALQPTGTVGKLLAKIESAGNRLPHPTTLFILFAFFTVLLSGFFYWLGFSAVHPVTGETIHTRNLVSQSGIHLILQKTVSNFVNFAPVGTVLVAMLGLGIAERSGFLGSALKLLVLKTSSRLITPIVVFAGVLSSLAADAGYVVLIPLAGLVFRQAGKHPVAGMAAAFAGVSGGYSANLMVGPIDAVLSGITNEASRLVSAEQDINILANYYFIVASTFLITLLGTLVTEKLVLPNMPYHESRPHDAEVVHYQERRGLKNALIFTLLFIAVLLACTVPENGIMRHPETGSLIKSPFVNGIVTLISLWAALSGIIFGLSNRSYRSDKDIIKSMEDTMAMMAGYLVLMFFAAQFVNYFAWSNLGLITAIKGSTLLQALELPGTLVLVIFILLSGFLNLLVGSASAKWAVMAPVFVPMLLLSGIPPEATQAAYRVGDSSTNIITPLMPYFGVVIAFMQRHDKALGIGSVVALMLPYSLCFIVVWSVMFAAWFGLGLPFGP